MEFLLLKDKFYMRKPLIRPWSSNRVRAKFYLKPLMQNEQLFSELYKPKTETNQQTNHNFGTPNILETSKNSCNRNGRWNHR